MSASPFKTLRRHTCFVSSSDSVENFGRDGRSNSLTGEIERELYLSKDEIKKIRKTWKKFRAGEHNVEEIFMRVFTIKPSLLAMYKMNPDLRGDKLRVDEKFLEHSGKFGAFLDKVVAALGDTHHSEVEDVLKILRRTGMAHCRIDGIEFTADNWMLIKNSILWAITGTNDTNNTTYQAWAKLLIFMVSECKSAYLTAVLAGT